MANTMTIAMHSMLISDMSPKQYFQFSRHNVSDNIIWQKKGTRVISRINLLTNEILATYYFTKKDKGYCVTITAIDDATIS